MAAAVPFLLTYPFPPLPVMQRALDCVLSLVPDAPRDLQQQHLPQLQLMLAVLKALLSRVGLAVALEQYCPSAQSLAMLRAVLTCYVRLWTCINEKAEALHAASEEVYKYKVKVCKFEEDDDRYLRRLREMFPSYKESFSDEGTENPDGEPAPVEETNNEDVKADTEFERQLLVFRAKLVLEMDVIFRVYNATCAPHRPTPTPTLHSHCLSPCVAHTGPAIYT